jgi:hypothetical protein
MTDRNHGLSARFETVMVLIAVACNHSDAGTLSPKPAKHPR